MTWQSQFVEATRPDEMLYDRGSLNFPGLLHHADGVIRNDKRTFAQSPRHRFPVSDNRPLAQAPRFSLLAPV